MNCKKCVNNLEENHTMLAETLLELNQLSPVQEALCCKAGCLEG